MPWKRTDFSVYLQDNNSLLSSALSLQYYDEMFPVPAGKYVKYGYSYDFVVITVSRD